MAEKVYDILWIGNILDKEEPAPEKSNTGLIIGVVAAVVVIGAGLGIILGKKKKA